MPNRLFLLLFLFISTAYAGDQYYMDIGVWSVDGIQRPEVVTVGFQEDLWTTLKYRLNGGIWSGLDTYSGPDVGLLVSTQLGLEVESNGVVASAFTGPALAASSDIYFKNYLQMQSDLHFGVQDRDLNYIGVYYKSFSANGLDMLGVAGNSAGLEIRFPF